MKTIGCLVVVGMALLWIGAAQSSAQDLSHFDKGLYANLTAAGSPAQIAPGTRIDATNWTKYRAFMPVGMQAFFSGKYYWKLPAKDYIVVGPTVHDVMPRKYRQDTEKYSGQSRLVPLPSGAFNIANYTAGEPFPNPSEPDIAAKLLYDYYYVYIPYAYYDHYRLMLTDRYQNHTQSATLELFFKLMHVSDVGQPINNPLAGGYFLSLFDEVLEPEQSKYTCALNIYPDNPNRYAESYVFLPSLRRSIRLSSAARCSPLLGTDWTNDDERGGFSGIPNWFKPVFLGEKKLLTMQHIDPSKRTDPKNYYTGVAMGFPKPVAGTFELRDMYIIDLVPTAEHSAYCYGHRVLYLDKDLLSADEVDLYDVSGKLWKLNFNFRGPIPVNHDLTGQPTFVVPAGDEVAMNYELQNNHADFAYADAIAKITQDVPAQYRNVSRYALPGGLDQVMQ